MKDEDEFSEETKAQLREINGPWWGMPLFMLVIASLYGFIVYLVVTRC